MSAIDFIRRPGNRLDVVAGLIDGILNALTLAAGRLANAGGEGATLSLAVRVSVAAGATTIVVFFIAHYSQLRLELISHERELNFTEHGKLAATQLGRRVFRESLLSSDAGLRLQFDRRAISSGSLRGRAVAGMARLGDHHHHPKRARSVVGDEHIWIAAGLGRRALRCRDRLRRHRDAAEPSWIADLRGPPRRSSGF